MCDCHLLLKEVVNYPCCYVWVDVCLYMLTNERTAMRVCIWIREEDVEAWQDIDNKSQWVHDMLNDHETDLERRIRVIAQELVDEGFSKREQGY